VCLLAACVAPPALAAAQGTSSSAKPSSKPAAKPAKPPKPAPKPDTTRWEVEAHVTYGSSDPSSGGKGALPAAGPTFQTAGGSDSRRVTSWYFADGAVLLNDVLKALGRGEQLVPLDSMLTGASAEQTLGNGFGVRVTHKWTPKLTIETAFEYTEASYSITTPAKNALKATSDSFVVAFGGLAASAQGAAFINPQLNSTFTFANGTGADLLATGALVFEGRHGKRLRPYVLAGGGVAIGVGSAEATLQGRYQFGLPSSARVDESDGVSIHFKGGAGLVALGGGGVKVRLWRQLGVQADARVLAVQNHLSTVVDTHPTVAESLPADALWLNLSPSIQFSTHPSTGHSSSLSGPGLSGFSTLSGSGFRPRYMLSLGGYIRF